MSSREVYLAKREFTLLEAAAAAGVSDSTVRNYVRRGWVCPERRFHQGCVHRNIYRDRDVERIRQIAAKSLDYLSIAKPGLFRYFVERASRQGRNLPLPDARC
jgi:hypothetical protein